MLREHGEIWDTLDAVEAQLAGGDLAAACRGLLEQLDRHNSKEEPIIYPQADTALSASASAGLRAFLECGQMPNGLGLRPGRRRDVEGVSQASSLRTASVQGA